MGEYSNTTKKAQQVRLAAWHLLQSILNCFIVAPDTRQKATSCRHFCFSFLFFIYSLHARALNMYVYARCGLLWILVVLEGSCSLQPSCKCGVWSVEYGVWIDVDDRVRRTSYMQHCSYTYMYLIASGDAKLIHVTPQEFG